MDNNNHQGGKFINGFLLGLIIGAGVVFLFGTKKGKRLLKNLSEDGFGNITDILEQAGELEEDELEETPQRSGLAEQVKEVKSEMRYPVQAKTEEAPKKPLVRRFFRRSKNP